MWRREPEKHDEPHVIDARPVTSNASVAGNPYHRVKGKVFGSGYDWPACLERSASTRVKNSP
jgi:hypothetical protein